MNEGSKDSSLMICKKYDDNSKIKMIDQKNTRVSNARNAGIEYSQGDFLCFVDADDWVEKNYLFIFVNIIEDEHTLLIQDIYIF